MKFRLVAQGLNQPRRPRCFKQPIFPDRLHVHPLKDEHWINELCVCVCVYVCVCARVCAHIVFVVGMIYIKNIFILLLKVIQTFSGVNKCTSCTKIFKESSTQRTDSGFFIYTGSDMVH